jgi:hypothetical protein
VSSPPVSGIVWLVRWMIVPVLLLPMMSAVASGGWRGFRAVGALARQWLYWVEAPLLLLCTLRLPLKLLGWAPHFGGFGWEMVSFVLRAAAAYVLFVAAGLALAFVTSGGKLRGPGRVIGVACPDLRVRTGMLYNTNWVPHAE